MKFQTAFIFATVLAFSMVIATEEDKKKLIDGVIGDLSELIEPTCFNRLKSQLTESIKSACDTFLDGFEEGVPVVKDGLTFNLTEFADSLFKKDCESVPTDCIEECRETYKQYVRDTFGGIVDFKE